MSTICCGYYLGLVLFDVGTIWGGYYLGWLLFGVTTILGWVLFEMGTICYFGLGFVAEVSKRHIPVHRGLMTFNTMNSFNIKIVIQAEDFGFFV